MWAPPVEQEEGTCLFTLLNDPTKMIKDEATRSSIQQIVNEMYPTIIRNLHAHQSSSSLLRPILADKTPTAHSQFMTHPISVSKDIVNQVIIPNANAMVISEKSDGIRCWLLFFTEQIVPHTAPTTTTSTVVTSPGQAVPVKSQVAGTDATNQRQLVVALTRNGNMWMLDGFKAPAEMFKGSLIDGEALPPEYDVERCSPVSRFSIFDIVEFCATRWIQRTSWTARMKAIDSIVPVLHCSGNIFAKKEWQPLVTYISKFDSVDEMTRDLKMPADGWIIQSQNEMPYKTARGILAQKSALHSAVTMSNKMRRDIDRFGTIFKLKFVHTIDVWVAIRSDDCGQQEVVVACDDESPSDIHPLSSHGAGDSELWRKSNVSIRLDPIHFAFSGASSSTQLLADFVRDRRMELGVGASATDCADEGYVCIVEMSIDVQSFGTGKYDIPDANGVDTVVFAKPLKIRTDKDVANSASTIVRTVEDSINTPIGRIFEAIKHMSATW
jgi:hypothetical protein